MAAALQYLREQGLTDYDALAAKTNAAVDRAHTLGEEVRAVETRLSNTTELMAAVVEHAKDRPIFDGYKATKYSKKYLAEHESELDVYRVAKATMNELLGGAKLPKMEVLKKKRRELAEEKKKLYAEYRQAQKEMREAVTVKTNVDYLLGATEDLKKSGTGAIATVTQTTDFGTEYPEVTGVGEPPQQAFLHCKHLLKGTVTVAIYAGHIH